MGRNASACRATSSPGLGRMPSSGRLRDVGCTTVATCRSTRSGVGRPPGRSAMSAASPSKKPLDERYRPYRSSHRSHRLVDRSVGPSSRDGDMIGTEPLEAVRMADHALVQRAIIGEPHEMRGVAIFGTVDGDRMSAEMAIRWLHRALEAASRRRATVDGRRSTADGLSRMRARTARFSSPLPSSASPIGSTTDTFAGRSRAVEPATVRTRPRVSARDAR